MPRIASNVAATSQRGQTTSSPVPQSTQSTDYGDNKAHEEVGDEMLQWLPSNHDSTGIYDISYEPSRICLARSADRGYKQIIANVNIVAVPQHRDKAVEVAQIQYGEQFLTLDKAEQTQINLHYRQSQYGPSSIPLYLTDGMTLARFFDMMSSPWRGKPLDAVIVSFTRSEQKVQPPDMTVRKGDQRAYRAMLETIAREPCWRKERPYFVIDAAPVWRKSSKDSKDPFKEGVRRAEALLSQFE